MKNKQIILCLLPVILSSLAFGQEAGGSVVNRYFVYFSDKAGDSYPYKVSNPEEFLTQRSIDRKSKQNISIKVTDLPVNPEYVQQLRDTGAEVFFSSRWFNVSLIHADTNFLSQINALAFVDSVALVADTTVLSFKKQETEAPTVFDDPPSITGNSDIQLTMLGATQMHEENVKGQGMLIAVLDNGFTGVNRFSPFQHVWEDNRIVATKDFVRNSGNVFQYGDHGTSVFSIIGANYSSAEGDLIGIAPEASFILCVTEENRSEDRVEEYNWLLAAEYADSLGADVINASVGYKTFDIPSHNYSSRDLDGETAIISRAAEMASNKGMIVVTSAGNTGRRNPPGNLMGHPADARGILAVGSVEPDFTKSDFSSVGPTTDGRTKPDLSAFGGGTAVMRGSGKIERGGGTSFASPLIAGLAACIWQLNPDRTVSEVILALKGSSHMAEEPDNQLGWGVPNYAYAKDVRALNVADILEDRITVYPNPFVGDTLFIKTEGTFKKGMSIKILGPDGKLVLDRQFKKRELKGTLELLLDSGQQGVYFLFLQTGNNQKVVKLLNF